MPRQRFLELDGLRGLAAVWVVLYHLTFGLIHFWFKADPDLAREIAAFDVNILGLLAVDLFFIISGFVITMSLDRSPSVGAFAASRFARLFPAYWAAVAVSSILGLLLPQAALPVTPVQALVNLTMLEEYFRVPLVDPSYWSLSDELGFYALMAVIIATRQQQKLEQLGLLFVLAGAASQHLLPALGLIPASDVDTGIVTFSGLFYAGILFYRIRVDGFTWWRAGGILLGLISRAAFSPPIPAVVECAIFAVFALAVAGRLPVLRTRPLLFLGSISYSLYVVHQPLAVRLQVAFHALGAPPLLNLTATLVLVLTAATLLAYGIEHPGAALLRRRFAPPPVPAAATAGVT